MKNAVLEKSMDFAIRIVRLCKWLREEKKEYILTKQLLRSGTSVGANLSEAQAAMSEADFLAKVYISYKECKETDYWITLLHRTDYLDDVQFESVHKDVEELEKLLSSITKTVRQKKTANT